jgi:multiple sugar transport system permease protein
MAAVIVVAVWKGFPFSMLVYLAALQTVDRSQIEAATSTAPDAVAPPVDVDAAGDPEVILINIDADARS